MMQNTSSEVYATDHQAFCVLELTSAQVDDKATLPDTAFC